MCLTEGSGQFLETFWGDIEIMIHSICILASHYRLGRLGLQQDQTIAMELYARAADLGYSNAHNRLGSIYDKRGI
jgi:hypothetical protein